MWFFYALITLFAWSGSDLFSKIGSRPDDKYSHWKMVMSVGLVMGLHALYQLVIEGVVFDAQTMLTYLPVSALYILAMILGYVGLRYIELSISSPICNSSGAVAAILCFIFLGARMNSQQLIGVALVCAGVLALSILEKQRDDELRRALGEPDDQKHRASLIALLFPILYCLIDGLGTFADAVVLETLDEVQANMAYEFTFLALGIFAFIYVVLIKKQRISVPRETPKLLAALCETAGQFTYVFAIAAEPILAAPTIASYSVFSVLWSRIFLKEKLTYKHYIIIGVVMCGIFILGFE